MLEAIKRLYNELGVENPDIIADYDHDYISINKCRNGRDCVWYLDESKEACIYIDTLEFMTDEEIEKELC